MHTYLYYYQLSLHHTIVSPIIIKEHVFQVQRFKHMKLKKVS